MKRVLIIGCGIVLIALGGGYLYLKSHEELITTGIARAVQSATGKPLVLAGPPSLTVFPHLGLDVRNARWGEADKDDLAVTCGRASIRIALMPLFSGRVDVSEVLLDEARVQLRTGGGPAVGQNVGQKDRAVSARPADATQRAPGTQSSVWPAVRLDLLEVTNSHIEIEQAGQRFLFSKLNLRATNLGPNTQGALRLALRAEQRERAPAHAADTVRQADLECSAAFTPREPVLDVRECALTLTPVSGLPITKPLGFKGAFALDTATLRAQDVHATLTFAGSQLEAKGAMDIQTLTGEMALEARLALAEALGAVRPEAAAGLPRLDGSLALTTTLHAERGRMTARNLNLVADTTGLHAEATGQVALDGPAGQLAFSLKGAPRPVLDLLGLAVHTKDPKALAAVDLRGGLTIANDRYELKSLKGQIDETTLSGQLAYSPHSVQGVLKLGVLDADRYLPVTTSTGQAPGQASGQASGQAGSQAGQTAPAAKAGSAKPAPAPVYPDVQLELGLDSLRVHGLTISTLAALVQGKAGRYAVEPCTFRFYESAVNLSARAGLVDQQYALKLAADKLNAGALLHALGVTDTVSGRLNLRADLSGRGPDEAALRRSLGGTARLTGEMQIDTRLLPDVWLQVIRDVRTIVISSLDVNARADKGRITLKPIAATGQVFTLDGEGLVDLPSDTLDLRLPATLAGITLPFVVRGTLAHPGYGVDAALLIQKNVLENPEARKQIERGVKKGAKELEKGVKGLLRGLR